MASLRRLNPNAEEFVPCAFKPVFGAGRGGVEVKSLAEAGKAGVEGSSDDDLYQQYWLSQLPENLISDFDVQTKGFEDDGGFGLDEQQQQQQQRAVGLEAAAAHGGRGRESADGAIAAAAPFYLGGEVDFACPSEARGGWGEESDLNWVYNSRRSASASGVAFGEDLVEVDPVALLSARFPGFAVKSLTELLSANGGDLGLSMEMLTQLELQDEAEQFQPPVSAPLLPSTPADFPALAGYELVSPREVASRSLYGGLEADMRKVSSSSEDYRAASPNFAAVARKGWHSSNAAAAAAAALGGRNLGLPRASQVVDSSSFFGRLGVEDKVVVQQHKFQLSKAQRHPPKPWLDTGEAVSALYADMREEARDHARARNVCFEQARQAYIAGNRALAKELSAKGHQLNDQMKAAHDKAGKAIFHERNAAIAGEYQKLSQGKARLLDLHGLHVKEAVQLLKQELKTLRLTGSMHRSKQQMFVCVGTGHHTPGPRALARLPLAIKQYLATEEHDLQFTETEPGMLLITL